MELILLLSNYASKLLIVAILGVSLYFMINIGNKYVDNNKKINVSKKYIINLFILILFIYILIKIYQEAAIIKELLYTVFISLILAYLLNPLVNLLEKRKIKRTYGVLLVYIIGIAVITLLVITIVPNMVNELKILVEDLPIYFNDLNDLFNKYYNIYAENMNNLPSEFTSIKDSIDQNISKIQGVMINSIKMVTTLIFSVLTKIISIILIPVLTFYFIKDKEYFKKKIILLIPKAFRNDIIHISRQINDVLSSFIRGQLIVATFIGIATSLGLLFLKIKFGVIIGLLAGIFSIIPYFGPIIGIVPAVLFALLDKPIKILWVIILFTLIQQFEGDILSPKIVGNSVGLHPITVMISLLVGGSLMGMLGLLLAVPIVAILKIIVNSIIERISSV